LPPRDRSPGRRTPTAGVRDRPGERLVLPGHRGGRDGALARSRTGDGAAGLSAGRDPCLFRSVPVPGRACGSTTGPCRGRCRCRVHRPAGPGPPPSPSGATVCP
jgi:hypothetical protein